MTNFGRRYHVVITSVLRRWMFCILSILPLSLQASGEVGRPSSEVFAEAMEGCLAFYETHDFDVFKGWEVLRELERSCDNCSTLWGILKDSDSEFLVQVELTDRGEHFGVTCQSDDNKYGPLRDEATEIAVNRWVNSQISNERLRVIPERERGFPREALKSCFRADRPLAVSIIPRQVDARFSMDSGIPTGMNPDIPACEESS